MLDPAKNGKIQEFTINKNITDQKIKGNNNKLQFKNRI